MRPLQSFCHIRAPQKKSGQARTDVCLFAATLPKRALGLTQPSVQKVLQALFTAIWRQTREAEHLHVAC
jgi:hypothetical protein